MMIIYTVVLQLLFFFFFLDYGQLIYSLSDLENRVLMFFNVHYFFYFFFSLKCVGCAFCAC